MQLQIITPEQVIYDGEIDAVTLPGKDGEFQILNNHAPIVATLGQGTIHISVHEGTFNVFDDKTGKVRKCPTRVRTLLFDINGGTIEMSNNKVTVLAS